MQGIPTLDWIDYASGKSKSRYQFGVENDAFITDVAEHPEGYLICASSGVTGRGTHFFIKPGAEEPFYNNTKISNIHAVASSGRQTVCPLQHKPRQQRQRPPPR